MMKFYNPVLIIFLLTFSIFASYGLSSYPRNPDDLQNQLLIKLKNNDKSLQDILNRLNIKYKEIKRLHTIVRAVYKVKKDLKLEKNKRGKYLFQGIAYKNIDDILDEELFKIAYEKMNEIEKKNYRTYSVTFPKNTEIEKIILQLKSNPDIESVEKNLIMRIQ